MKDDKSLKGNTKSRKKTNIVGKPTISQKRLFFCSQDIAYSNEKMKEKKRGFSRIKAKLTKRRNSNGRVGGGD